MLGGASGSEGAQPSLLVASKPSQRIGTTVLWELGTEQAASEGLRTLVHRAAQAEAGMAFSALADLVAPVFAEVADELPAPRRHALEVALLLTEAGSVPPDPRAIGVARARAHRHAAGGPAPRRRPAGPDRTLYDILRELDPAVRPVPLLLPAVSDARFFARLGIQIYGFLPMQLPPEMRFMELIHAEDERIPVDALDFGTAASGMLIDRMASPARRAAQT
jgi:acetylornithine deacetylase/succinyl-diaminopimelate desuccinylase-like protein